MNPRAVCAVIIGNEVLTAKVVEANGTLLIRRLRERGIELSSVHLVRDEVDELVEQLAACRRRARYVITSGGVGPTHDDVTVRAVALALQRPVVRLPEMEARIRAYYAGRAMPFIQLKHATAGERMATRGYAEVTTTDQENRVSKQRVYLELEIGIDHNVPRIERISNYVVN